MNQAHDTDTNSACSSVLFALLLRYYTPNIKKMKLTRRLNLYVYRVPGSFDSKCLQAVRCFPSNGDHALLAGSFCFCFYLQVGCPLFLLLSLGRLPVVFVSISRSVARCFCFYLQVGCPLFLFLSQVSCPLLLFLLLSLGRLPVASVFASISRLVARCFCRCFYLQVGCPLLLSLLLSLGWLPVAFAFASISRLVVRCFCCCFYLQVGGPQLLSLGWLPVAFVVGSISRLVVRSFCLCFYLQVGCPQLLPLLLSLGWLPRCGEMVDTFQCLLSHPGDAQDEQMTNSNQQFFFRHKFMNDHK